MESKVVPVAQGEIKEIVSQDHLVIKIHVEVLPEVTVDETKMKKIKLIRKKISVSDADVKTAIADIEKRFSTFKETAKKMLEVVNNDYMVIDANRYLQNEIIPLGINYIAVGMPAKYEAE